MLVTLQEALDFCDVGTTEFVITGNNNRLYFKYDGGATTLVTLTNNSYDGDALATHLTTVANTALSSTLAVTWSSTTEKFTIAEAAHTIQYIHANSTAGYTIGFTEDSSAAASITSDTACGDPTDIITTLRAQVDKFVKNYCRRDFESASFSEIHDGDGSNILWVNEFPITAITRLSIGTQDVMSVNNSSEYNYATVSSDGTNLTLSLNGSDTTIAYADYATIALLIAQINATGSGWSATVSNTDFNSFASTEIVNTYGQSCLDEQTAYLGVRNANQSEFKVDTGTGKIINSNYFAHGNQNVYITYTAGYSTIPEDLKQAVLIFIKYLYAVWLENSFGLLGYKIDDISKYDLANIPSQVRTILGSYKRFNVR